MNKKPGNSKNTSLGSRMKEYESVHDTILVPRIPVYVRLDGRAFHTFCRTLQKPFDSDFVKTMASVTSYLVGKTNAMVGYFQSDEISLVYESTEKMPFGGRIFKIESVFAGMASSAFCVYGQRNVSDAFKNRVVQMLPHFDCRIAQMPLDECANMLLWRERDSIKNSITLLALTKFSQKQLDCVNGPEKIKMLKDIGIDYYSAIPENLRNGSYFKRVVHTKTFTAEDLAKIPEKKWPKPDENGDRIVVRSSVDMFSLGMPLDNISNKVDALFYGATPIPCLEKDKNNEA